VQPNAKIAWLAVVCQGTRELVEFTTHYQVTVKIDGVVGHPCIIVCLLLLLDYNWMKQSVARTLLVDDVWCAVHVRARATLPINM
jgi:hypothetical protein